MPALPGCAPRFAFLGRPRYKDGHTRRFDPSLSLLNVEITLSKSYAALARRLAGGQELRVITIKPGGLDLGKLIPRSAIWLSDVAQASRLYIRRGFDPCPWNRSEHGDLQRGKRRLAAAL